MGRKEGEKKLVAHRLERPGHLGHTPRKESWSVDFVNVFFKVEQFLSNFRGLLTENLCPYSIQGMGIDLQL